MTQVNFSGSGIDSIDNQVGKGQGLKVGTTKINFASGKIQLNDAETIGFFRNLKTKGAKDNTVRSFAFKSTAKCIIEFQDTFIDYNLINEWLVLKDIETELISIIRTATGLTTDIFNFSFIGSDTPNFSLSIEKGTRDSDLETLVASASKVADTYFQNINKQGAKSIILIGKQTDGTGTVTVSAQIFDPASSTWIDYIPNADIFSLANGETKTAMLGDSISRKTVKSDEFKIVSYGNIGGITFGDGVSSSGSDGGIVISAITPLSGYAIPSGDNVFRLKIVVNTNPATFSIGIQKVFN